MISSFITLLVTLSVALSFSFIPVLAHGKLTLNTRLLSMAGGESKENSNDKLKLVYFNGKGVAELSRIIFKFNNIDFVDVRCTAKMENGKFITPEFDEMKTTGELNANMNRLPCLILPNGITIGESKAIEKYLASKFHMMGNTIEEYAQIECISENIRDIKEKYSTIRRIGGSMLKQNDEKDAALKKWFEINGELQSWLEKLEKSLPSNINHHNNSNVKYSLSDTINYGDLCIWSLICDTFDEKYKDNVIECMKNCPKMNNIIETVNNNEGVKSWLTIRPITIF